MYLLNAFSSVFLSIYPIHWRAIPGPHQAPVGIRSGAVSAICTDIGEMPVMSGVCTPLLDTYLRHIFPPQNGVRVHWFSRISGLARMKPPD